jgi:hypothetical protein
MTPVLAELGRELLAAHERLQRRRRNPAPPAPTSAIRLRLAFSPLERRAVSFGEAR